MPEDHFSPTPVQRRETFRHLARTAREGLRLARSRPVVRGLLLISLFVGLASEAFDRLWLVRIVEDFPLPPLGCANVAPGLPESPWSAAWWPCSPRCWSIGSVRLTWVPAILVGCWPVLTLVQVSACSAWRWRLWLALAALWLKGAALAVAAPVEARMAQPGTALRHPGNGLVDERPGERGRPVVGGPPLGVLAGRTTVSTALVVPAGLLSLAVAIFGWLGRRRIPPTPSGSSLR